MKFKKGQISPQWCELSPPFEGFWCWAINCILLVLICKVLDVSKCIGENLCNRSQGLLAPQLPAPTGATASFQAALGDSIIWDEAFCIFLSKFAPAESQFLPHSWTIFPGCDGLLWNATDTRNLLPHSFWWSHVVRSSLSNVVPCDWVQAMSTPASKGSAASGELFKTRNVANKVYI